MEIFVALQCKYVELKANDAKYVHPKGDQTKK